MIKPPFWKKWDPRLVWMILSAILFVLCFGFLVVAFLCSQSRSARLSTKKGPNPYDTQQSRGLDIDQLVRRRDGVVGGHGAGEVRHSNDDSGDEIVRDGSGQMDQITMMINQSTTSPTTLMRAIIGIVFWKWKVRMMMIMVVKVGERIQADWGEVEGKTKSPNLTSFPIRTKSLAKNILISSVSNTVRLRFWRNQISLIWRMFHLNVVVLGGMGPNEETTTLPQQNPLPCLATRK